MKPIPAPRIIQTGIVVYAPGIENFNLVRLRIFYSSKNPIFNWSFCDESPHLIWDKTDENFDKGLIFTYQTRDILQTGYYKINIDMTNNSRTESISGSQIYGILQERSSLYIGLPYSAFPPINVA